MLLLFVVGLLAVRCGMAIVIAPTSESREGSPWSIFLDLGREQLTSV